MKSKLNIVIDVKEPIAMYCGWELFLNPTAKTTYGETPNLFTAKKVINGVRDVDVKINGMTIHSIMKKIDVEQRSSDKFRKKCKTLLTDIRKCEYCADRFLCFTTK